MKPSNATNENQIHNLNLKDPQFDKFLRISWIYIIIRHQYYINTTENLWQKFLSVSLKILRLRIIRRMVLSNQSRHLLTLRPRIQCQNGCALINPITLSYHLSISCISEHLKQLDKTCHSAPHNQWVYWSTAAARKRNTGTNSTTVSQYHMHMTRDTVLIGGGTQPAYQTCN